MVYVYKKTEYSKFSNYQTSVTQTSMIIKCRLREIRTLKNPLYQHIQNKDSRYVKLVIVSFDIRDVFRFYFSNFCTETYVVGTQYKSLEIRKYQYYTWPGKKPFVNQCPAEPKYALLLQTV